MSRFIVLAALIVSSAAHAQKPEAFDAIFQKWNRPEVPGCALGIEHKDSPPLTRTYGSADLEHDIAIDADTVFEAGSVSKQFVAASILVLVEQGKLAVTDDVRKYVPELPDYGARITIEHLLNHTSGLRDWGEIEAIAGWPRTTRTYTPEDVLDIIARQTKLNYSPGAKFSYTNSGYNLLALIVQRVSGSTLAEFSRVHFFVPLKMSHTQWRDNFRRVVKHRAIAYRSAAGGYEQEMPFENAYGNGGMLTTIGDLLRWNRALDAGELGPFVTKEFTRQGTLTNGETITYARGLYLQPYRGVQEISHAGATASYRAWLGRYPSEHLSIALLCNAGDANTPVLSHAVADLYLSGAPEAPAAAASPTPPPSSWKPTAAELKRFVGKYHSDEALATYLIVMENGDLLARPTDRRGAALKLRPTQADTFAIASEGAEGSIHFQGDGFVISSARVYALTFHRAKE